MSTATAGLEQKKRSQHACDQCKKRKVRCDSSSISGDRCSSCMALGVICTYHKVKLKPGPRPGSGRKVISQACKDLVTEILNGTASECHLSDCLKEDSSITSIVIKLATRIKELEIQNDLLRQHGKDIIPEERPLAENAHSELSDSEPIRQLTEEIAQFHLQPPGKKPVHYGESSSMFLVLTAMAHRKQVDSTMPEWRRLLEATKRPQYWDVPSWLRLSKSAHPRYEFPDADELKRLSDAFFDCNNLYTPLLHRPSFEKCLSDKVHERDEAFGALVLAVCAIGSRYLYAEADSTDPNVMFVLSGMKWYQQLPIQRFAFAQDVSLWHLQMYCISMIYLQNISTGPDVGWMIAGIAIRLAQEQGVHRRFVLDGKSTSEGESWKRVFWILMFFDFKMSMVMGRPTAMSPEDFDLGFPIECDDEYWDDPDHPFVQPPGKPSVISFWNHFMRIHELNILAAQALYSVRRSKIDAETNRERAQKAVFEIDSALNKWADAVPSHLRWDLKHQDKTFFKQSALLYLYYYSTQIGVHRRFIPSPGQDSGLPFPSMTICTNAARSCIHITETCLKQTRDTTGHFMIPIFFPLFNSAMVLAISLWRGKQVNPKFNPQPDLADIYKCIDLLRQYETKHTLAGRSIDIINAVVSATHTFFGSDPQSSSVQKSSTSSMSDTPSESTPLDSSQNEDVDVFIIDQRDLHLPLHSSDLGQSTLPIDASFLAGDVSGYVAPQFGYNPSITTEELAIFDDVQKNFDVRTQGFTNDSFPYEELTQWPSDLSQPQDWDMFMSNMDQLLSTASR